MANEGDDGSCTVAVAEKNMGSRRVLRCRFPTATCTATSLNGVCVRHGLIGAYANGSSPT